MRCYECGREGLEPHENFKANRLLIESNTGQGHKCDPGEKRVTSGIWAGYTFKQMADLVASRNGWTKGRIKPSEDTL